MPTIDINTNSLVFNVIVPGKNLSALFPKSTEQVIYPAKITGTPDEPQIQIADKLLPITPEQGRQLRELSANQAFFIQLSSDGKNINLQGFKTIEPSKTFLLQLTQQQMPQVWPKLTQTIISNLIQQLDQSATLNRSELSWFANLQKTNNQWLLTTPQDTKGLVLPSNKYNNLVEGKTQVILTSELNKIELTLKQNSVVTKINLAHIDLAKLFHQGLQESKSSGNTNQARANITIPETGKPFVTFPNTLEKFTLPSNNKLSAEQQVFVELKAANQINVNAAVGKLPLQLTLAIKNTVAITPDHVVDTQKNAVQNAEVTTRNISPNNIKNAAYNLKEILSHTNKVTINTAELLPQPVTKNQIDVSSLMTTIKSQLNNTLVNNINPHAQSPKMPPEVLEHIANQLLFTKQKLISQPMSFGENQLIEKQVPQKFPFDNVQFNSTLPKISSQLSNELAQFQQQMLQKYQNNNVANLQQQSLQQLDLLIKNIQSGSIAKEIELISVLKAIANDPEIEQRAPNARLIETLINQQNATITSAFTPVIGKTSMLGSIASALSVLLGAKQLTQTTQSAQTTNQLNPAIFMPILTRFGLIPTKSNQSETNAQLLSKLGKTPSLSMAIKSLGQLVESTQLTKSNAVEQNPTNANGIYFTLPMMLNEQRHIVEFLIDKEQKNNDESQTTSWKLTMKLSIGEYGELLTNVVLKDKSVTLGLTANNEYLMQLTNRNMKALNQRLDELGFSSQPTQCLLGEIPLTLRPITITGLKV